jgi:hypothetical protein
MLRFVVFETDEVGMKWATIFCECCDWEKAKLWATQLRAEYPARKFRLVGVYTREGRKTPRRVRSRGKSQQSRLVCCFCI